MDPLVASMLHNQRCSRLCQLPDELLINITQRLDPLSDNSLRHACRLFLRIYSSPELSRNIDGTWNEKIYPPVPWAWAGINSSTVGRKLAILQYRDIDKYCTSCRLELLEPRWTTNYSILNTEYLHCSACHVDHPVGLFSKEQRTRPPKYRMCIGHEGYIRICEHKAFKWAGIETIVNWLKRFEPESASSPVKVTLGCCKSCSHIPEHHGANSTLHHEEMYPTATIEGSSKGPITLEISWTGHLPVVERTATPTTLRSQFEQFRSGVAQFIAPERYPGRIPEMNCFDPHRCSCLDYPGLEQLSSRSWALKPLQDHHDAPTCRSDPARRLFHRPRAAEALTGGHKTTLLTTGKVWDSAGHLEIAVDPCAGGQCLRVRYRRKITFMLEDGPAMGTCLPTAWYQALDPDSYNPTDDQEGFGVLWCRQPGCKNYYRYLKGSLVSMPDANRSCTRSCPAQVANRQIAQSKDRYGDWLIPIFAMVMVLFSAGVVIGLMFLVKDLAKQHPRRFRDCVRYKIHI
ncbi:hypothetical protein F5B20DRAFT_594033 [Whalleya microplaca]|nr:hypothetical protein F5B20DRAFT_594033 [Whalleya microplaca]